MPTGPTTTAVAKLTNTSLDSTNITSINSTSIIPNVYTQGQYTFPQTAYQPVPYTYTVTLPEQSMDFKIGNTGSKVFTLLYTGTKKVPRVLVYETVIDYENDTAIEVHREVKPASVEVRGKQVTIAFDKAPTQTYTVTVE